MNLLDASLVRKYTPLRKALAYTLQTPRGLRRLVSGTDGFWQPPPIVVNSVPKSGTHLLMQVARALPSTRYYGSFLSQQPSLTLKTRSQSTINSHIRRIVPGEVLGAHLHYSEETSKALEAIGAVHLMIIRDPAELLMSEVYYLAHMNRYHRMARVFRDLDEVGQLKLALNGWPERRDLYPDFSARLEPYAGWLNDPRVCVVRYEEFTKSDGRRNAVRRIVAAWASHFRGEDSVDIENLAFEAETAIKPERSHTTSGRKRAPVNSTVVSADRLAGIRAILRYSA